MIKELTSGHLSFKKGRRIPSTPKGFFLKSPTVVKSNAIIEAGYRLSLSEQRLVLMCIAGIEKGNPINENEPFIINAHEFAEQFDLPLTNAYRDLQVVAERLYERSVTIYDPDPDNPKISHTKTRWISSITYIPGEGELMIGFAHKIIPYISMLKGRFTRYSLDAISGMNSTYGLRFYELMKKWQTEAGAVKNTKEILLTDLKKLLDIETKYKAIKDFKKYVVEPAIKDINTCSELIASYTQKKKGRRVTHLIFHFETDQQIKILLPVTEEPTKIDKKYIEKHAYPGESYQQAKDRLNQARRKTNRTIQM